jgi:hypothetical protein
VKATKNARIQFPTRRECDADAYGRRQASAGGILFTFAAPNVGYLSRRLA